MHHKKDPGKKDHIENLISLFQRISADKTLPPVGDMIDTQLIGLAALADSQNSDSEIKSIAQLKVEGLTHSFNALRASRDHNNPELAIHHYQLAIKLYEKHKLQDVHYALVKRLYAESLQAAAGKTFAELQKDWSHMEVPFEDILEASRFYHAYGDFLAKTNIHGALKKYIKAKLLAEGVSEGVATPETRQLEKKIAKNSGYSPRQFQPAPEASAVKPAPTSKSRTGLAIEELPNYTPCRLI